MKPLLKDELGQIAQLMHDVQYSLSAGAEIRITAILVGPKHEEGVLGAIVSNGQGEWSFTQDGHIINAAVAGTHE